MMAIFEMVMALITGLAMLFIILLVVVGSLCLMLLIYCGIKLINDLYHLSHNDL